MQIDLVPVAGAQRSSDEDWYIHADGMPHGYIYRVENGYAVGIDFDGEIKRHSIEPNKDAALAFALKHISANKDRTAMDKDEFEYEALKLFRASTAEGKDAMIRFLRRMEEERKAEETNVPGLQQVESVDEARDIAKAFAESHEQNEAQAEAYAETWFDAGKDFDKSSPEDLRSYLARRFKID